MSLMKQCPLSQEKVMKITTATVAGSIISGQKRVISAERTAKKLENGSRIVWDFGVLWPIPYAAWAFTNAPYSCSDSEGNNTQRV